MTGVAKLVERLRIDAGSSDAYNIGVDEIMHEAANALEQLHEFALGARHLALKTTQEMTDERNDLKQQVEELQAENQRLDKMNDEFQTVALKHQTERDALRQQNEQIHRILGWQRSPGT